MRLLKQLVPVALVAFAGGTIVGAVQESPLLTGPEASPYAVVSGLLLTVAFMWLVRRRGNVVPLRRGATVTLAQ
ncbi:LPXTG cell wall anchor domain-containing protein [Nonomuraea dietziae]|uniref:LPXTG cell wall anchor domain-containing protein n=1 Tax=Nonomuraea dietziae TaxID=65515 RepID=UPI00340DD11B